MTEHADRAFDRRLALIKHAEEAALRQLWDAKEYLQTWPFAGIPMPIDFDFACTLVEVFIPHHIFATLEVLDGRKTPH